MARLWIEPPLEPPDDYYNDGNCMDFTCEEEEKAYYEGWWRAEDWRDEDDDRKSNSEI